MKRAWDPIKLRVAFWHAERAAEVGDELRTDSGRRYLILGIKKKQLQCVVLPSDSPASNGFVFRWTWSPRTKK